MLNSLTCDDVCDVFLAGRVDGPLSRLRRERRISSDESSGWECWRKIGAPGDSGSTGVSNGRAAGARLEREAVGRVTRGRPRRKYGEPDRGMFGVTAALGGRLRVGAERAGRGDVRASRKFSMVSDEGEMGGGGIGEEEEEGFEWPNQRKTGCGGLWGDLRELGGGVGMMSGDKWRLAGVRDLSLDLTRREAGATLLEECMLGPERVFSEVKMRLGVHCCRGERNKRSARSARLTPRCRLLVLNCLRCSLRSPQCRMVGLFSPLNKYMSCYPIVVSTTKDQINTGLARATNPAE